MAYRLCTLQLETILNCRGSEIHLTNVIYNLVDNALKYGNGQSKIDLALTASDDHLDFSIRDYGIGIAKEYQKKIFEKFFRVPTGDVHDIKGYGLGLNYVAGVVHKHGGTIGVESEIGKGSLFKIRLPKNGIFHRRDAKTQRKCNRYLPVLCVSAALRLIKPINNDTDDINTICGKQKFFMLKMSRSLDGL